MLASHPIFQTPTHISRCTSSNPLQDLRSGSLVIRPRSCFVGNNKSLYPFKKTDYNTSSQIFNNKFRRLRLRPSTPTLGEKNLRLQWQKNSAMCNKLFQNQADQNCVPTNSRSGSRNSKLRPNVMKTLEKTAPCKSCVPHRYHSTNKRTTQEEFKRKGPSEADEFQVYSISTQTLVPRRFTKTKTPDSTPTTFSPLRWKSSAEAHILHSRVSPLLKPPTPLNSPYVDDLRIIPTLPEKKLITTQEISSSKRKSKPQVDIIETNSDCGKESHHLSIDLTYKTNPTKEISSKDVNTKEKSKDTESEAHIINDEMIFHISGITSSKAKQSATEALSLLCHKEVQKHKTKSSHAEKTTKAVSGNSNRLASNCSPLIRIQSFHPKTEEEEERNTSVLEKNFVKTSDKRRLLSPEAQGLCVSDNNNHTTKTPSTVAHESPLLKIKHIDSTDAILSSTKRFSTRNINVLPEKNKFLRKNAFQDRVVKKNSKYRACKKGQSYSFDVEQLPTVPNPSLVDYGKKSVYTYQEETFCRNSLFENDQDPTIMLRILSWLDKVENNPDLYYGFDDNEINELN